MTTRENLTRISNNISNNGFPYTAGVIVGATTASLALALVVGGGGGAMTAIPVVGATGYGTYLASNAFLTHYPLRTIAAGAILGIGSALAGGVELVKDIFHAQDISRVEGRPFMDVLHDLRAKPEAQPNLRPEEHPKTPQSSATPIQPTPAENESRFWREGGPKQSREASGLQTSRLATETSSSVIQKV